MPSPLIIPGVQVKTILEPSPSLPSLTGILGVVGVTDRGPLTPTPVGSMGEFVDIFGPASRFSMPKVRAAFGNGVSRMVIARTSPGPGTKASLGMLGDEGETVATLIARAEGSGGTLSPSGRPRSRRSAASASSTSTWRSLSTVS